MTRPRAADDFTTIRARIEELRRERASVAAGAEPPSSKRGIGQGESEAERRRRARMEGWPPPWVPTVFARRPRH